MNLYKRCTAKSNFFLVIDANLASESFAFQKESFRKNIKDNHENW